MLVLLFYSQECLGFSAFLEALQAEAVFVLFVRMFLYQSMNNFLNDYFAAFLLSFFSILKGIHKICRTDI